MSNLLQASTRILGRLFFVGSSVMSLSFVLITFSFGAQQRPQLLQEGYEAFYRGEMKRAEGYLESYLGINPGNVEARILLARILAGQGRNAESLDELKTVLDEDPKNPDALFYLSSLASALSQAEYGRLYRLAPDSDRVHQLMAASYLARGLSNEAESEFLKARERNPQNIEVLIGLAALRREQKDWGKAKEYLLEALRVDPNHATVRLTLAILLIDQGSLSEAVGELSRLVRENPKNDRAYFQLGRAYELLGNNEEANVAFQKARILKEAQIRNRP